LWVRIPPGAWMFVCCECCVLLGIGLCDGLITRPEESYRLWCVVVCDQETSKRRRLKAHYWAVKIQLQWVVTPGKRTICKQLHLSGHHSWYKLASCFPGTKERPLKPYELEVAAVCTSETSKQITHYTLWIPKDDRHLEKKKNRTWKPGNSPVCLCRRASFRGMGGGWSSDAFPSVLPVWLMRCDTLFVCWR
jgi:hypothetical protein